MRPTIPLLALVVCVGCQGPRRHAHVSEVAHPPGTGNVVGTRGGPGIGSPTITQTSAVVPCPGTGDMVPARTHTTTTYKHHCNLSVDYCNFRLPFPHLRIFTGPDKVITQTEYLHGQAVPRPVQVAAPVGQPALPVIVNSNVGPGSPQVVPGASNIVGYDLPPGAPARLPVPGSPGHFQAETRTEVLLPPIRP